MRRTHLGVVTASPSSCTKHQALVRSLMAAPVFDGDLCLRLDGAPTTPPTPSSGHAVLPLRPGHRPFLRPRSRVPLRWGAVGPQPQAQRDPDASCGFRRTSRRVDRATHDKSQPSRRISSSPHRDSARAISKTATGDSLLSVFQRLTVCPTGRRDRSFRFPQAGDTRRP